MANIVRIGMRMNVLTTLQREDVIIQSVDYLILIEQVKYVNFQTTNMDMKQKWNLMITSQPNRPPLHRKLITYLSKKAMRAYMKGNPYMIDHGKVSPRIMR
jgi:hypothetical protein